MHSVTQTRKLAGAGQELAGDKGGRLMGRPPCAARRLQDGALCESLTQQTGEQGGAGEGCMQAGQGRAGMQAGQGKDSYSGRRADAHAAHRAVAASAKRRPRSLHGSQHKRNTRMQACMLKNLNAANVRAIRRTYPAGL